jgi:uncharacterized small protein (DUF1192 family)
MENTGPTWEEFRQLQAEIARISAERNADRAENARINAERNADRAEIARLKSELSKKSNNGGFNINFANAFYPFICLFMYLFIVVMFALFLSVVFFSFSS